MKFTYATGDRPLDGFQVKHGVGRGGFGEVYFALSDGGKEVALKLIRANLDIELRGIRQCLNLKHPNLVHLYDLRTDPHGDHWLVMEYVRGEPLSAILGRHPYGVGQELAAQWFQGIAAAVHCLHDQGIVHRDLKPGNIFLENGIIKVGDYGLCKLIDGSVHQKQTQSVGTVHYMAPEISTGKYQHQVDVYSAGIILYEMLTGRVPFDGQSAVEILFKHQTERPDLSKVPSAFVPILDQALSKNPALRFQSIKEMSDAVAATTAPPTQQTVGRDLLASTVVHGEQPSETVETAPTLRERLAQLSGSLLLANLLAAGAALFLMFLLKKSDPAEVAPIFFLTCLGAAAVLVPARWWPSAVDESWNRRLVLMGCGLALGLFGLWLDGFQIPLPWHSAEQVDSLRPLAASPDARRHPVFGLLYPDNHSLPVLACYLSYFGLMFLALRWWRLGEPHRPQRFSLRPVLATAFWAYILLFLLPAAPQRMEAFTALVLTSAIVQLVSPWHPRVPERQKRWRLRLA